MTGKTSVYEAITAKIIAAVEADPGRHKMPWHRNPGEPLHMPSNALTANHYRGVNVVMLWVSAEVQGFRTPIWGTYRQWAQRGAQVRQGEKSTAVIFYKEYETAPAADTPDVDGTRRVVRASAVFNADQVDGAPPVEAIPDLGMFVYGSHIAHSPQIGCGRKLNLH